MHRKVTVPASQDQPRRPLADSNDKMCRTEFRVLVYIALLYTSSLLLMLLGWSIPHPCEMSFAPLYSVYLVAYILVKRRCPRIRRAVSLLHTDWWYELCSTCFLRLAIGNM